MTNFQMVLMQGLQDYLLLGSMALLAIGVVAKAITMSARRDTPPQPESQTESTFSIGSYRTRVLTPSY